MRINRLILVLFGLFAGGAVLLLASKRVETPKRVEVHVASAKRSSTSPTPPTRAPISDAIAARIVAGAKKQAGTLYDPAYVVLKYPGGDVDKNRGACTDVVIRALRFAGTDLQRLMHEDMKRNFGEYPRQWGLSRTDKNIDHRRVPNQMKFFERRGQSLTKIVSEETLSQWQPGDIVCWRLPGNLYHTGVLTDEKSARGLALVMHNLSVCAEEDVLTAWPIIGHYRYPRRGARG